ncbi:NfeD family protein [Pseudohoeflea suaedae]|uniref:NfeD family protein n=1 Tax=Pseudohoeflea suaedae TaxID=877384 RepID=A0A4R5PIT7_9HYPH|nr:NfeD family protein [Pseudohoeflea suaedae]TDH35082.1 NfeD family protein [Pseudohoeflea suaedae]
MIDTLISEVGPWSWWILGLLLLGAEIIVPGMFLIWIGLAAIVVGAISFALWDSAIWSWQIQLLVFAVLSLVSALVGRKIMASRDGDTDQPMLNRRMEQMIGRTATLEEPITEGQGRIRLGDTLWTVRGPDLPVGSRVRIVAIENDDPVVQPV